VAVGVGDLVGVSDIGIGAEVVNTSGVVTLLGVHESSAVFEGTSSVENELVGVVKTNVAGTEASATGVFSFSPVAGHQGTLDSEELGRGGVLLEAPLDLLVTKVELTEGAVVGEDHLVESAGTDGGRGGNTSVGVISEVVNEFGGDAFADVSLEAEVSATHQDVVGVDTLDGASSSGFAVANRFPLGLNATSEGQALSVVFFDEDLVEAGGQTSLSGFV